MRKRYELLLLLLAVWILKERNVPRCQIISRKDNNALLGMSEQIETIIGRIEAAYNDITIY
jgi:hypothetical protein